MHRKIYLLLLFLFVALTGRSTTVVFRVGVVSNEFSPTNHTILLGDTVRWEWNSGVHGTMALASVIPAGAALWSAPIDSVNTTFFYVPTVTGSYNFFCTRHTTNLGGSFVVNPCSAPARPYLFASPGSILCGPDTIRMGVNQQQNATYQWYKDGVAIPGATTSTYGATVSGSYTTRASRCGYDTLSAPFVITINPRPQPSFTTSVSGTTVTFNNTTPTGPGIIYSWDFGDSQSSTLANPVHTYATTGQKTVSLYAQFQPTGCSKNIIQTVDVPLGITHIGNRHFSISPNPASSHVLVTDAAGTRITLIDLYGRIVAAPVTFSNQNAVIDVSGLPTGMYLVRIATPDGIASDRISVIR